ncbi:hypothetical protein DAETH_30020 [Deinococcus aetherius]|uniref:Integral membrane protein n=1 Tax=Deinococcus aetherius TaxID=200252 RepID=A0ABM8AGV5_9DEIO|nr:hypothetical protein [Deinococcus aetherius]BDP43033.1 hypothetical protein DAETH_30020 [Deinococcus aetherius]
MTGWLGAGLLILAGFGWGTRLSARRASTVPLWGVLLLTLGASVFGLVLTIEAFLVGQDAPLVVGAVGALAAAMLAVFTAREE